MQVLGLKLEYEGAPLRYEKKQTYLARKIAERKAKSAAAAAAGAEPEVNLVSYQSRIVCYANM